MKPAEGPRGGTAPRFAALILAGILLGMVVDYFVPEGATALWGRASIKLMSLIVIFLVLWVFYYIREGK